MKHDSLPLHDDILARIDAIAKARAPQLAAFDVSGEFPHDHIAALRSAGLLGLTAPTTEGGQGAGLALAAEVIRAIGYSDPATALVVTMHYLTLATLPQGRWDPVLQRDLLQKGAKGALINALRVEPDLGTPMRGGLPATTARRHGEGWRLSGRKIYSTGSPALSYGLVWARTDEETPRVGQFLVAMNRPGIRIEESWDSLGLRSSASHDVIFDDVALPASAAADLRLPEAWEGRNSTGAAWGNVLLAALYTGVAEAARDWTAGFLQSRVPANLGRPLATLPRMQEAIGGVAARIAVNLRLIRSLALEVDGGTLPAVEEGNIVKLTATENAISAVEACLKLTGNHGISRRNPLERHFRDALCGRIHSPQEDSILQGAGRVALGL